MAEQLKQGLEKGKKASARPDFATVGGILLAFGGIVGGLLMEGGKIKDISQLTAAFIVLGGTFGAVMVSTPIRVLNGAALRLIHVLMDNTQSPDAVIEELIGYATKARKKRASVAGIRGPRNPGSIPAQSPHASRGRHGFAGDSQHDATGD